MDKHHVLSEQSSVQSAAISVMLVTWEETLEGDPDHISKDTRLCLIGRDLNFIVLRFIKL